MGWLLGKLKGFLVHLPSDVKLSRCETKTKRKEEVFTIGPNNHTVNIYTLTVSVIKKNNKKNRGRVLYYTYIESHRVPLFKLSKLIYCYNLVT